MNPPPAFRRRLSPLSPLSISALGLLLGQSLVLPAAAQFFTAPTGPGGTWNLYEVTHATATWKNAHLAATTRQAGATGVTGVTGNTQTGHLIAINSWQENSVASILALRHTNSSNVWIGLTDSDDADLGGAGWTDAGTSTSSGQWFWAGTAGGTGPGGALSLTDTGHNAFFPGEPNNSTGAQTQGEDAVELRTDGRWNDNAHTATATTRRYIIEWDISSAVPIPGAAVIPTLYTAPYGDSGKWNLYMMVAEGDTWLNAHNRATATEASATGLAALAGNTTKGHLLEISSRMENGFASALANRLLRNNNILPDNDTTTNLWIGLTDSEDINPGITETGSTGANTGGITGWCWAGTTGGNGPGGLRRIEDSLDYPSGEPLTYLWNNAEPNDATSTAYPFGEDAAELIGLGRWNDIPHKTGAANANTTTRRYLIEWPLNAAAPIAGAELNGFFYTARHGAGNTWNLYFLDYTRTTWNSIADRMLTDGGLASYTGIPALAGSTVRGHLVEIRDLQEHASVYRMANGQGIWLGLTDDPVYGGQESGNASTIPEQQIAPYWIWSGSADQTDYRRWNAGEPNNSNTENAGEMTAAAGFNDLPQAAGANIRRALLEWPIQSATPIAGVEQLEPIFAGTRTLANTPAPGTWAVKTISDVTMTSLRTAARATQDGATNGVVLESTSPVINFNDLSVASPNAINFPGYGDSGLFAADLPFPGDTSGADNNHYVIFARTKITVTAADSYTFNVHADDSAALRIVGQQFTQVFAPGFIDGPAGDTIYNAVGSGDSNTRGVVNLAPGTYDVEFLGYESTGGSAFEVSWSPGVHATDESPLATWTLVGDSAGAYPAPLLPAATANTPEPGDRAWGIHTVKDAGQLNTLAEALAALANTDAGTHAAATAPVINHSDPSFAGTGGMFPGEFTLPSDNGDPPADDNDFAMQAHGRLVIDTAGLYTFGARHSENIALRIRGQRWLNVGGEFGIDPADPSTVFTTRNSLNQVTTTEFTSRAVAALQPGTYDVDFIAFDRDGAFFTELYSRIADGSFVNTAEYVTGAEGAVVTMSGDYRLAGYRAAADNTVGVPGVDIWTRAATTPTSSGTAPANWGGTTVAYHDIWFEDAANGASTTTDTQSTINERDPQNPTGVGGLPNDRPFIRNTAGEDNYYVERFTANLTIPRPGTYTFGWQGDDGGYFQIEELPAGVGFERIEAAAVPGSNLSIVDIPDAPAGTGVRGRLQLQAGGGNTKSLARITFPEDDTLLTYPATFAVRSQHFEGTGGSYWEILSGVSSGYGRPLLLLEAGAANATAADVSGLALEAAALPGTIRVTHVELTAGNLLRFTFDSEAGRTYRIERSSLLTDSPWQSVETVTAGSSSTTWTQPAATITAEPRNFYRARLLP